MNYFNAIVIQKNKSEVQTPQPGTKTWLMELMKEKVIVIETEFRLCLMLSNGVAITKDNGVFRLNNIEENLAHKHFEEYTIKRVYEYELIGSGLDGVFEKEQLNLLWQREEDINPIEIKEWLEATQGLHYKISTFYISQGTKNVYNIKGKTILCGGFGNMNAKVIFKTHKEALQWLKDNLVKPELTVEERLERLERHTNLK